MKLNKEGEKEEKENIFSQLSISNSFQFIVPFNILRSKKIIATMEKDFKRELPSTRKKRYRISLKFKI